MARGSQAPPPRAFQMGRVPSAPPLPALTASCLLPLRVHTGSVGPVSPSVRRRPGQTPGLFSPSRIMQVLHPLQSEEPCFSHQTRPCPAQAPRGRWWSVDGVGLSAGCLSASAASDLSVGEQGGQREDGRAPPKLA